MHVRQVLSRALAIPVIAIVAPVCVAGAATVVAAFASYASTSHSATDIAAVAGLFVGMVLAERFPVPVEGVDAGGVTLGFVFAVAAIVLFGWAAGVIVAAGGPTVTHLVGRRPPLRVAYNGSMFALAALVGGLAIEPITGTSVGALLARIAVCDPARRSVRCWRGSRSARSSTTGSSISS